MTIPNELKQYKNWVIWNDKKVPFDPKTGKTASSNDPATWGTFEEANKGVKKYRKEGIGFVFSKSDPFVGIDLDGLKGLRNGNMPRKARELVKALNSYTEISPSGKGLHIIVKGKLHGPGINADGIEIYDKKRYFTVTGNHYPGTPLEICRMENLVIKLERKYGTVDIKTGRNIAGWQDEVLHGVSSGARHATALKLANLWFARGASVAEVEFLLIEWNKRNKQPKQGLSSPDQKELQDILRDAQRHVNNEAPIAERVQAYVDEVEPGEHFTNRDIYESIELKTPENKAAARQHLKRLKDAQKIVTTGINGRWKKLNLEIEVMDLKNANQEERKIWLPCELHRLVRLYEKNIVVIAGAPDGGKTAWAMQIAYKNIGKFERIIYCNSESGAQEFAKRVHEAYDIDRWEGGIQTLDREDDFDQIVGTNPDGLTVVDYLEIPDKYYLVDGLLSKMHHALGRGICVVCLQKNRGVALGDGGSKSLRKPRLYITLEYDRESASQGFPGYFIAGIEKAKSPRKKSVLGQTCTWTLDNGGHVRMTHPWTHEAHKQKMSSSAPEEVIPGLEEAPERPPKAREGDLFEGFDSPVVN